MSSLSNIKAWWKHIDSKIKDGTVNKYSKRVLRKVLEGVVDDNAKLIYIIELKEEQIKDMNILFRPALVANPKLLKENEELKAKLEEFTNEGRGRACAM